MNKILILLTVCFFVFVGVKADSAPVSILDEIKNLKKEIKMLKDNAKNTLPGAVVSFDLNECPDGWGDYQKAYGRFIRGIDKSNESIDAGGKRDPGSFQEDTLASHQHRVQVAYGAGKHGAAWSMTHNNPTSGHEYSKMSSEGGKETRPKNVSLLFCKKLK